MRAAAASALVVLLAAGTACGKKGPPVAPELRLPAAPAGLAATVDVDHVVLTWNNPASRVDGTRLRDLSRITLYRREEPDGAPPKPAMLTSRGVAGYDEVAKVSLDAPGPAVVERGRVTWEDRRDLSPGRQYVYAVTATDASGRTSAPSRVAITLLAAPRPPRDVQAAPGDAQVTLAWSPPAELADGAPAADELRYVVMQGRPDGALTPVTPEPISATRFVAGGLENDSDYRFAVRAVRVDPRATVLGPPSEPVAATPVDTTPPSAPRDLVAVPSPGAVTLAWRPSPEPDVALYAVYRSAGDDPPRRVGTAVGGASTYTDRDVRPGLTYRYTVTALDRARRPNESARSNEATAALP